MRDVTADGFRAELAGDRGDRRPLREFSPTRLAGRSRSMPGLRPRRDSQLSRPSSSDSRCDLVTAHFVECKLADELREDDKCHTPQFSHRRMQHSRQGGRRSTSDLYGPAILISMANGISLCPGHPTRSAKAETSARLVWFFWATASEVFHRLQIVFFLTRDS